MIVYSTSAEVSVARLFLGGFLPGMLIGLRMAAYIIWYACRHPLQTALPFSWSACVTASLDAIWALREERAKAIGAANLKCTLTLY